ncbi:MAG: hypothetical protein H7Y59_12800 [Anaerolineales bacterium]|nr:hypothetical protein [Anaerolineales bacterium]
MTIHRFFLLTVSLLAVSVAVSCAPAAATNAPTDAVVIPATEAPINSSSPEATASVPAEVPVVEAAATSRGPNLEATDPTTVNLASGQLQLVEFFRFT